MQQFAADLGPGEPVDQARMAAGVEQGIVQELGRPQVLLHRLLRDQVGPLAALGHLAGDFPADLADRSLQVAHAGLVGVAADNDLHDRVVQFDLAGLDAVLADLPGQQVLACDHHLLFQGVTGQLDDLHAVQQRAGDGVTPVGGGDEHDLGKIERQVHIVIGEGVVLLRVEHLEQGRGGVAAVVVADLVDLVHHEHRIVGAHALQTLQNTSGQGADVGPPVTADFGLVAHAAQRQPVELAAHGLGDGLAERGLAHAGGTDKADDRAFGVLVEFAHGQVFEDALLDPVETVVVLVEDVGSHLEVEQIRRRFLPGQVDKPVQIGADDGRLGGVGVHHLQPLELLLRLFLGVLGHLLPAQLLAQVFDLLGVAVLVAEFALERLDLLAQEILALAARHLLLGVGLDLGLDRGHFQFLVQQVGHQAQPLGGVDGLKDLLRLGDLQAQVGAHQVGQPARLLDIVDDHHQIRGEQTTQTHDFFSLLAHGAHQRLGFDGDLTGLGLVDEVDLHPVERLLLLERAHPRLGDGLHQHLQAAVGQFQGAHDHRHHAHAVQVFLFGIVLGRILLGDQHEQLVFAQPLVDGLDGAGPTDKERDDHVVEHHHIAHRHHGQGLGDLQILRAFPEIPHTGR